MGTKSSALKNSESLMLSCTTEITPEDAEKMRDIALTWWDEYDPEHLQSLINQMFAWKSPGTKYDTATIADWLETEDELVRERITELIHLREQLLS